MTSPCTSNFRNALLTMRMPAASGLGLRPKRHSRPAASRAVRRRAWRLCSSRRSRLMPLSPKPSRFGCDPLHSAWVPSGDFRLIVSIGGDQVSHFRRAVDLESLNQLLQFTVGVGHPFMLAHMLDPGIEQERLDEAALVLDVLKHAPVERAVAAPLVSEPRNGLQKRD